MSMKKPYVEITYTAMRSWRRIRGYAKHNELASEVAAKIMHQMKLGIQLNDLNKSRIRLRGNMIAVIKLSTAGWKVLDFTKDTGGNNHDKLEKCRRVS